MTRCPTCKKPLPEPPPTTAPFCSDRCKLIDLGRWLDGAYQIPIERDEANGDDDEPLDVWVDPKAPKRDR